MQCNLCGKDTKLVKGHIIPNFISKDLKFSTKSPYFRNVAKDVNVPLQDLEKTHLFCKDCDNHFSKYENYFAKNVYKKTGYLKLNLEYVNKFITFTNYKILLLRIEDYKDTIFYKYLFKLKTYLKDILQKDMLDMKNKQNILFLDDFKKIQDSLLVSDLSSQIIFTNNDINQIFRRQLILTDCYKICFKESIEFDVCIIDGIIYIFFKIPKLLIVTTSLDVPFGLNVKIKDDGMFNLASQKLWYNLFWQRYLHNVVKCFTKFDLNDDQFNKIEKRLFGKVLDANERKLKLQHNFLI